MVMVLPKIMVIKTREIKMAVVIRETQMENLTPTVIHPAEEPADQKLLVIEKL